MPPVLRNCYGVPDRELRNSVRALSGRIVYLTGMPLAPPETRRGLLCVRRAYFAAETSRAHLRDLLFMSAISAWSEPSSLRSSRITSASPVDCQPSRSTWRRPGTAPVLQRPRRSLSRSTRRTTAPPRQDGRCRLRAETGLYPLAWVCRHGRGGFRSGFGLHGLHTVWFRTVQRGIRSATGPYGRAFGPRSDRSMASCCSSGSPGLNPRAARRDGACLRRHIRALLLPITISSIGTHVLQCLSRVFEDLDQNRRRRGGSGGGDDGTGPQIPRMQRNPGMSKWGRRPNNVGVSLHPGQRAARRQGLRKIPFAGARRSR